MRHIYLVISHHRFVVYHGDSMDGEYTNSGRRKYHVWLYVN